MGYRAQDRRAIPLLSDRRRRAMPPRMQSAESTKVTMVMGAKAPVVTMPAMMLAPTPRSSNPKIG